MIYFLKSPWSLEKPSGKDRMMILTGVLQAGMERPLSQQPGHDRNYRNGKKICSGV
jgi:hypothetical protein